MNTKYRLGLYDYAMLMAKSAALRSEDPVHQVGAVALTSDGRIVATGYNGLASGVDATFEQWHSQNWRLLHVVHAEMNLCSLFSRGEVATVVTTVAPCQHCAKVLIAHGIRYVVYESEYARDSAGLDILQGAGVKTEQLRKTDHEKILKKLFTLASC